MFKVWPRDNISIGIGDISMNATHEAERDHFMDILVALAG